MRSDRLCFTSTLQYEQLREDSYALKVDGKRPHNFLESEDVVEDECEYE